MDKSTFDVQEEERLEKYEEAWADGRFHMQTLFNDVMTDPEANRLVGDFVREKIRDQLDDPAVADKLTPRSYPLGAKRLCLDTDYYATFNRENVELVDLNETPIERITARGIKTSARGHELDLIIFATGFDAITGPLMSLGITGLDGMKLNDAWKDGPTSYLGIATPGFPNLFTVTGPFSPSVLTNVIRAIEHHVDMIADCIEFMRANGCGRIEADDEATAEWMEETRVISEYTLFPKANSWYVGANVPGKPRHFMVYVGGLNAYVARCEQVAANGWTGFRISAT
jgi:cyclohexanone monooxygenase